MPRRFRNPKEQRRRYDRGTREASLAVGLCRIAGCFDPLIGIIARTPECHYCFRHWIYYLLSVSRNGNHGCFKVTSGRLNDTEYRRRDRFVVWLHGRFIAVRSGQRRAVTQAESLRDTSEIKILFGITWGGQLGLFRLAKLVSYVERHANTSKEEIREDYVSPSKLRRRHRAQHHTA